MAEQPNVNHDEKPTPPAEPEQGKAEDPEKTPEQVEQDAEIGDRFEATDN